MTKGNNKQLKLYSEKINKLNQYVMRIGTPKKRSLLDMNNSVRKQLDYNTNYSEELMI